MDDSAAWMKNFEEHLRRLVGDANAGKYAGSPVRIYSIEIEFVPHGEYRVSVSYDNCFFDGRMGLQWPLGLLDKEPADIAEGFYEEITAPMYLDRCVYRNGTYWYHNGA